MGWASAIGGSRSPPSACRRRCGGWPRRDPRYRLAVSLHAPNDELRHQIVPVSEKIPLAEILAEADHYFERSGRRLTFEYVLLAGINDSAGARPAIGHALGRPDGDGERDSLQSGGRAAVSHAELGRPAHVSQRARTPRHQRAFSPPQRRRDRRRLRAVAERESKSLESRVGVESQKCSSDS